VSCAVHNRPLTLILSLPFSLSVSASSFHLEDRLEMGDESGHLPYEDVEIQPGVRWSCPSPCMIISSPSLSSSSSSSSPSLSSSTLSSDSFTFPSSSSPTSVEAALLFSSKLEDEKKNDYSTQSASIQSSASEPSTSPGESDFEKFELTDKIGSSTTEKEKKTSTSSEKEALLFEPFRLTKDEAEDLEDPAKQRSVIDQFDSAAEAIASILANLDAFNTFVGLMMRHYLSTFSIFCSSVLNSSLPLTFVIFCSFFTHILLPLLFLDKTACRLVLSTSSLVFFVGHLIFLIDSHLRFVFFSHFISIPMLFSLVLYEGFEEQRDIGTIIEITESGHQLSLFATTSFRSYLFIVWLRLFLLSEATLLTLDVIHLLALLDIDVGHAFVRSATLPKSAKSAGKFADEAVKTEDEEYAQAYSTAAAPSAVLADKSEAEKTSTVRLESHEKLVEQSMTPLSRKKAC